MLKRMTNFLIRNLGLILLAGLLVTQIFIWRLLVSIERNVDNYTCGTRSSPCKVIVVPDR